MELSTQKKRAILGACIVTSIVVLAVILAINETANPFLRTSVFNANMVHQGAVGGYLNTSSLPPGEHTLQFRAKTQSGQVVTDQTTFNVKAK